MRNRVTVTHKIMEGNVEIRFNGSLIKTYPETEVMDVYGMDIIMRDLHDFADSQNISLGEDLEIAYDTR